MKRLLLLLLLTAASCFAQSNPSQNILAPSASWPIPYSGVPTGLCLSQQTAVNTSNGNFYSCNNGVWQLVGANGIQFLASLPVLCTPGVTPSVQLSVPPYQVYYCSSTNTWSVVGGSSLPANSPGIPQANGNIYYATNYGVKADAQAVFDAVCSNGSNIITSATAHFQTIAKIHVGETMWTVSGAGQGGVQSMAKTTVQSIDSDSQIHSVANGNANCGAAQALVWGDDDTGALNTAWTAVLSSLNCTATLQLPNGMMMISGAIANTKPPVTSPCIAELLSPAIKGVSWQSTAFLPTPDFDLTTCSGAGKDNSCFGIGISEMDDFQVIGMGIPTTTVSGTTATIFHLHSPMAMHNMSCQNWAYNDPNVTNVLNDLSISWSLFGQYFGCGGQGPTFSNAAIAGTIIGSYAGAGNTQPILVQSASPGLDYFSNSFTGGGGASPCGVIASGFGHFFGLATGYDETGAGQLFCVDGGTVSLVGGVMHHNQSTAGRFALRASAGGNISLCNYRIDDTGTGEFAITVDSTSSLYSCGNNFINGAINITPGGIWIGPEANNGFCTGTATSSATLGLYALGENTVTTCTSTTTNLGVPARKSGNITGLNVTASHAGVNSSSGVFTVLVNGVASTVTCTVGTGTNCQDNTHFPSVNFGDIISIQFTTQAAEVLAGIKAQVILE
jgi:hypothetical protein